MCRGDRQRGPEAVGGDRTIATEDDCDVPVIVLVLKLLAEIGDRLRPSGRRRVLGSDAAAHRQRRGAVRVGIVEDDADIAAIGIASGPRHGGAERIGRIDAERQKQRS